MRRVAANLSVGGRPPALAAGVAAVGAQRRALHRVRGAGGGSDAALREAQASAVVLLTLHAECFFLKKGVKGGGATQTYLG